MTIIVVDRLRIRGPQGRRMARIAARLLPDALDAACADLDDGGAGDIVLAPLHVVLDPDAYDDDTIALLWADRIRGAALAAGARLGAGQQAERGAAAEPPAPGAGPAALGTYPGAGRSGTGAAGAFDRPDGAPPDVAAGGPSTASPGLLLIIGEWLARGAVPDGAQHAAALQALADPAVASAAVGQLPQQSASRLLLIIGERLARGAVPDGAQHAAALPQQSASLLRRSLLRGAEHAAADGPGQRAAGPVPVPTGRADDSASPQAALVIADAARRCAGRLAEPPTAAARPPAPGAAVTGVGGLVLLSPWLAAYCRTAVAAHPDLPAEQARTAALALLADPRDPTVLLDPLVALLAGGDPEESPPDGPADHDPDEAAETVLRRFAGLIRGFERSTPAFVRREWIARAGLLDITVDPVRLELQTRPLDLALGSLPYPTGLLRLPWTPAIAVRFVP